MELYQWQKKCLAAWEKNEYQGIADVATGTGKTVLALAAAEMLLKKHPDLHVRVVVPTVKLARQWQKDIIRYFHTATRTASFVQIYSSTNKKKNARFTIYVINTARICISGHIAADMKMNISTFLIVDECHRAASVANRNIFHIRKTDLFKPDLFFCIGLSATPQRPDFPDVLTHGLGRIIYRYHTYQAEADGIINPFLIMSTGIRLTGKEADEYGILSARIAKIYALLINRYSWLKHQHDAAFFSSLHEIRSEDEESPANIYLQLVRQRRSLLYKAANRLSVIEALIRHFRYHKVIIFSERIEQCNAVYAYLQKTFPNRVGRYHSDMDKYSRQRTMDLFSIGEYRILVTCRALDEGLNVPDASIGIIVSSSSVERQHIQRLGRILRRSDGKSISVLYYIYVLNTVENTAFLAEQSESNVIYQQYLGPGQGFICRPYEDAAMVLLDEMKDEPENELIILRNAVEEGAGSTDWLYPPAQYRELIMKASSQSEEDYWRIMKRMAEIHQKQRRSDME